MSKIFSSPIRSILLLASLAGLGALWWFYVRWMVPVWPDEAFFFSPAQNFARTGKLGADVLEGILPNASEHSYWNTPYYLLGTGLIYSIFGLNVWVLRLTSFLALLLTLNLIIRWTLRQGESRLLAVVATFTLFTDQLFLRAGGIGRVEIWIILTGMIGLSMVWSTATLKSGRLLLLGGVGALPAALHPLGIGYSITIGLLFLHWEFSRPSTVPVFLSRSMIFTAGILCTLLVWIVPMMWNWEGFEQQFLMQILNKNTDTQKSWSTLFGIYLSGQKLVPGKLWLTAHIFAGLGYAFAAIFDRRFVLLLIGFLITWLGCIKLPGMWYPVLVVPFVVLGCTCLAIVSVDFSRRLSSPWAEKFVKTVKWIVVGLMLCTVYQQFGYHRKFIEVYGSEYRSVHRYELWSKKVWDGIKPSSRVLINVLPDPTFHPAVEDKNLTIRYYNTLALSNIDVVTYHNMLKSMDYAVIGLGHNSPSPEVAMWVKKHGQPLYSYGNPQGYPFIVYRLKKMSESKKMKDRTTSKPDINGRLLKESELSSQVRSIQGTDSSLESAQRTTQGATENPYRETFEALKSQRRAAKEDLTQLKMRYVANVLTMFRMYYFSFPSHQEGLRALSTDVKHAGWLGPYLMLKHMKDAWGREFNYSRPAPQIVILQSAGQDGVFGSRDDHVLQIDPSFSPGRSQAPNSVAKPLSD